MRGVAALLFVLVAGPAPAQTAAEVRATAPALEKNLTSNILAFWYPGSIDREHGGFLIDHGADGKFRGGAPKALVTQARMLWLSSRLVRDGRGGPAMRAAAEQGYRFLMDRMWDRESGGFYWEVDRAGTTVVHPHKHLYGQAFGLYALAEYARATGSAAARDDARRLFALIEEKAHDSQYGGYREFFARDWGPPPPDARPYLGGTADLKLMNTHLHLMEALTTLYLADPAPLVATRLSELVKIQSGTVVRKAVGACTDQYERDWTPRLGADAARASYGHDLENIWLLVDALDALKQPVAPYLGLFRQLFEYSLKHGYDAERGGFHDSGPLGADADRRDKVWWVQAEALVSALTMYKLTGDSRYAGVYLQTWEFTNASIADWTTGEWHWSVGADGRGTGDKANRWKAGYHNGRAMLEAIRLVGELGPRAAADITTAPLPGGVEGLRRSLGDRVAMTPAMAVADLTRRFYNGTDIATDRDAGYGRLQAWLRECVTTPACAPASLPPDAVPLPGTPGFWREAGVDAPADRLVLAILGNRGAALLYTALLSMEPSTREWFLARPELARRLSESARGALTIAAPYLRLDGGRWRLPGGDFAEPMWAELVGVDAADTQSFVLALTVAAGGLVTYIAEVIATLSASQQAAVLGGPGSTDAQKRVAGHALLAALGSAVESWQPGERPFWRPSTDPAFLLARIPADAHGRLALPGGRKFWQLALSGADRAPRDAAVAAAFRDREPLTAAWLVATVAAAAPEDQPLVYQQVLFAARTLSGVPAADAASALTAIRGYARFPPLLRAMERIGVTDAPRLAAMVKQAHALTRAGDAWRARATLVQWQCAVALLERAARGGLATAADLSTAIDTLAAPIRSSAEPPWRAWVDAVSGGRAPRADVGAGSLERALLDRLTRVKVPGERRVEWEGAHYRVDFSAAERDRIDRVRGRDGRPLIDAAATLAGWSAHAAGLTPSAALAALTPVVATAGIDRSVDADDEFGRLAREAAAKARRQLSEGGRPAAARQAVEDLREALATAALVELVYAVHMGWADDLPLSAAAASRRHVFVTPFGPGRNRLWTPPAINSDRRFPWHVSGSALGLDVALAPVAMRRLSLKPLAASPLLNTGDRALLVTTAVVIDPRVFTDEAVETARDLESRARRRLDAVESARDAREAAVMAGASLLRASLAGWLAENDRPSLANFFSSTELVRMGLDGSRVPDALRGWGNYEFPLTGRTAPGPLPDLPWERYAGRSKRMLAYAAPDLQITLALRLAELGFPASLVPMLMASASLDLVNSAPSRHTDDWQALAARVQGIDQAAVERYLGLLTTGGPLRPAQGSSEP